MIDEDIATEWKIVSRLRERASQAESFGDIGLKIRLEEMIAEERTMPMPSSDWSA
jgi:hypothetical protein